jgi:hypothetical protein
VQYVYAERFDVGIPCVNYRPVVPKINVVTTKESKLKERDSFPALTQLMVIGVQHVLSVPTAELDLRTVIERLGDFWSACARLRTQLTLLMVRYPLDVEVAPVESAPPSLRATATVVLPNVKSKAFISYIFDWETYSRWPLSIASLKCDVKLAYGPVE